MGKSDFAPFKDTVVRCIKVENIEKSNSWYKTMEEYVKDYKAGKKKAIGFLVGQTMKATQGKANPGIVNKILTEILDNM